MLDLATATQNVTNGQDRTGTVNDHRDEASHDFHLNATGNSLQSLEDVQPFLDITNVNDQRTIVIFHSSQISLSPRPLKSALKLQVEWMNYINIRVLEWKMLFTVACLFVA